MDQKKKAKLKKWLEAQAYDNSYVQLEENTSHFLLLDELVEYLPAFLDKLNKEK